MSVANYSEIPPGQVNEPWLKTIARRLRDWLNGFLLEPVGSEDGGALSSAVLSSGSPQDRILGRMAERGDQTEAHPEGLAEDAGPPEAWLALVRERAPGLLLPVEEGAPWQELSSGAMEEERLSLPTAIVPLAESRSLQSGERSSQGEERSIQRGELQMSVPRGHSSSVIPRKPTWLQSLKRKFSQGASISIPEDQESRPRREHVASPLAAEHQSVKAAQNDAPALASRWSERIKQKIQGVVHTAPARASLSKADVAEKEKTRQRIQEPSAHGRGSLADRVEVMRSTSEVDRGSSEPQPVRFRRSELAFGEVQRARGQSQKDLPVPITNPKKWPPLPSTAGNPAVPREESAPAGTPKFEREDPWPELPEDPPVATVNWQKLLHGSERLRALDREQKGGR
jgi:hypothetical protein